MPEMVAPRALIFRPLVKGNEDSGNEIGSCRVGCHFLVAFRLKRVARVLFVFASSVKRESYLFVLYFKHLVYVSIPYVVLFQFLFSEMLNFSYTQKIWLCTLYCRITWTSSYIGRFVSVYIPWHFKLCTSANALFAWFHSYSFEWRFCMLWF